MKFDTEFKNAISLLSSKDKDKLILRLLKKDLVLANQLCFELISNESVQDRRNKMDAQVILLIERATKTYDSPGYLLMELRYISGAITEHVKTTKDKYGEASLNLLMLNTVLSKNNKNLLQATPGKSYTFNIYIVARAFKVLILIKALHEDFHIEFEDGLKELSDHFGNNHNLMKLAISNGFDANWLLHAQIPDDIVKIHKGIRDAGFLK